MKNKGEIYKLSPYKLIWSGDYYYVIGYSEKKGKVINFRVDRIAAAPTILSENAIPVPKDFDLENFTKEVKILFPKNVKEQYYKMISEAMNSLNNAR